MADPVMVEFEADPPDGWGEAPLTWGQQHIWDWICRSGSPLSMSAVRPLPADATIGEFVDELRFFMSRFQAMRTRLGTPSGPRPGAEDSGWPHQVVARSGTARLEIVDVADGEDAAAVAEAISARHKGSHFDYANEWPLRMALVRRAGALTHLVTTLCHVVVDSAAAMVMFTDLLARAPTGATPSPVAMGPLELAAWQRSPAGRRQSEAALRFWERQLRQLPVPAPAPAPVPAPAPAPDPAPPALEWPTGPVHSGAVDPGQARYWQFDYDSPAMYEALRRLTRRLAVDSSPVLLAAYALAVARVTGRDPVVLMVFASNRFRPGLADLVSPVNQAGLCVLDLAGLTFDEAVAHVRRRTMNTYKYAYYDQDERDALVDRIARDRGAGIDLGCWVNDRRSRTAMDEDAPLSTEDQVRAALPRSTLRRTPLPLFIRKLMFTANDSPDSVAFTLEADTGYLPTAGLESLARAVESIVVDAAFAPSGIAPIEARPG